MRTLENLNLFLVEKLGQKPQPTLLGAFNALCKAYGGEGKAKTKQQALNELEKVFVGPSEGIRLKDSAGAVYSPSLISLITAADLRNLDTEDITDMTNILFGCSSLSDVTFPAGMGSNKKITALDFSSCPLSVDSIKSLVTGIAPKTKAKPGTLTLKESAWTAATTADPSLETTLTAKHWSVITEA